MVKVKHIVIALFVVAVGICAVVYSSQSEEKRVKRQFDLLSEWVSKGSDENMIAMAQKMQKLGTLFDENCALELAVESLSGNYTRDEIRSYAARARSRFLTMSLKFSDLTVNFPETGTAKVNVTAGLTARTTAGERVNEPRELLCLLNKIEGKWLFNNMEVVEVLRK